jgi:hypothetical protein
MRASQHPVAPLILFGRLSKDLHSQQANLSQNFQPCATPLLSVCDARLQKSDGPLCGALQKERKAKEAAEKEVPQWKVYEVRALAEALLQHGEGRTTATCAAVRTLFWILSANSCVMAMQAVCLLVHCSSSGVGCQLHQLAVLPDAAGRT